MTNFGDFKIITFGRNVSVKNLEYDITTKKFTAQITFDGRTLSDFLERCTDNIIPLDNQKLNFDPPKLKRGKKK